MTTPPQPLTFEEVRQELESYDWRHYWRDRLVCAFRGHDDMEPAAVITCGPVDAAPDNRTYDVPGFAQQCVFCHRIKLLPPDLFPGAAHDVLAERRQEDWKVWDDPVARAEWLEMHEYIRADLASRDLFGDGIDE